MAIDSPAAADRGPAPASAAVLDRQWLDGVATALPPETFCELTAKAGVAIAEHLSLIDEQLAAGALAELAATAHRLAGLAATFGCVVLRTAAAAVERATRDGGAARLPVLVEALGGCAGETVAALWQAVEERAGGAASSA